ncbi:nucleotide exchange factor GrpE [Mycoplasma bradburyae]|uniref:nucleotide exchange factor GrpE n=1 Tax=Mycoplasma bradburyae TaxID=2963128 RepID=UPI0020CBA1AE|nr:nucleotide exchange factor GrpE [Mycoplasma bradburyae]MDC4184170.1 nucleotide exchange factor GrpE [Mycoplasma bradburyae]UTS71136.1 nucleotide exchange factor GrpE [Mycoplasma bradburyae]
MNNQEQKTREELKEEDASLEDSTIHEPTTEVQPTANVGATVNLSNENIQIKSSLEDLKNFVQNPKNHKQKIATVGKLMYDEFVKIENSVNNINSYIENLTQRLESTNESIKNKIQEVEAKAQKKISDKIEELDARKKEEIENAKKYAIEKSIDSAINVVDQLEIAIDFASKDPAVKNYVSGFKMVLSSFINWLKNVNIHRMDIKPGDKFDEKYMSASDKVSDPKYPADHVSKVMKSGYILYDRVIRHTMVAVSDGVDYQPEQAASEEVAEKPTPAPAPAPSAQEPAKQKPTAPTPPAQAPNKPPVVHPTKPTSAPTPPSAPKQPITHQIVKK